MDLPGIAAAAVAIIRGAGFPACVSLVLLYVLLVLYPEQQREFRSFLSADTERIVQRLSSLEQAKERQTEAILRLVTRLETEHR